jgi:hypothetical protein
VNEAQRETQVRSRITAWSIALGASLVAAYFYLILLLGGLSSGSDLYDDAGRCALPDVGDASGGTGDRTVAFLGTS